MSPDSPLTRWQSVPARQQPALQQQSTSEETPPNVGFIWPKGSQRQLDWSSGSQNVGTGDPHPQRTYENEDYGSCQQRTRRTGLMSPGICTLT